MARQDVLGHVHAVELPVVAAAILKMVYYLQSRAQRIGCGPGIAALAMDIEHKASDRHCRIAAVVHELVPVAIAGLADIHAEGLQQVLGVARRKLALGKGRAQPSRLARCLGPAEQAIFETGEEIQLLALGQRRVIGDIVGRAHELVKCQYRGTMTGMDQA